MKKPALKFAVLVYLAICVGTLSCPYSYAENTANTTTSPSSSVQGPVDIQANEQEFSGDQVIARGNVRVTYKDSVIISPLATLFRDQGGNPQKAVFTGRPKLTQGTNKIDAETLVFEINNQKVIAEGNAHSEVISSNNSESANNKAKDEKIITDSDKQEYDRLLGKFEAQGHVHVIHGDITVRSDKLKLVYGTDNKPETAVFTGNVTATQQKNSTQADSMTYCLSTRRLQATGHVKSKVIQEKRDTKKKVSSTSAAVTTANEVITPAANAATLAEAGKGESHEDAEETILIVSNFQDYSKESGRLSATGNVKVYYQDTIGIGPTAVLMLNSERKPEKVVFIGRSQICQSGKRWIADNITMVVADKKILAQGNTKAFILQSPKTQPAKQPNQSSRLAERAGATDSISSTKIETLQ